MSGGGACKANQRQSTRRKSKYLAYRHADTRSKNKAYRLIRHLERRQDDGTAIAALGALPDFCVKAARKRLKQAREK